MKFAVPRGTSDILPDAVVLWEELESKARKICKSYGYREIRTPVYEDINLFKRSLGATSDVVNKQLLELVSSREDEGCAVRPEGTASIVRSYIENSLDGKESLSKLFYLGPMFRGERPQKGRLRQFHQIGVEAIGPNSTNAGQIEIQLRCGHVFHRSCAEPIRTEKNHCPGCYRLVPDFLLFLETDSEELHNAKKSLIHLQKKNRLWFMWDI